MVKKKDLLPWATETGGTTAEGIAKRTINKISHPGKFQIDGGKVKSSLKSDSNDRAKVAGTRHRMIYRRYE